MSDSVKTSMLATLAYFDLFDHPLTAPELYRALWRPPEISFENFLPALQAAVEECVIVCRDGYYLLPGREGILHIRQTGLPFFEEKMKIAKRAGRLMRWIPFMRAFFVCNTVAASSAKKDSDIDVFIVVKAGRLWLARLFTTLLLSVFGLRRTKSKIANKICLSFYVTDNTLDLSSIILGEPDIYLMYWIDQLMPIYDPENIREVIIKKNNWVNEYLPYAREPYDMSYRYRVDDSGMTRAWRRTWETMWGAGYGDMLEAQAKGLQQSKMKANYKSVQDAPDSRVVISDTMLKFHENDRRIYYREMWEDRCRGLDLEIRKLLHC